MWDNRKIQDIRSSECLPEELQRHLPGHQGHLMMLARVVGGVVGRPLLTGNRIDPLVNGDQTYPAMLEAIRHARQTVSFVTYIFALVSTLNLAAMRGVQVDILLSARSNLSFVMWASGAMWSQVLRHGCRIWLTPPPLTTQNS